MLRNLGFAEHTLDELLEWSEHEGGRQSDLLRLLQVAFECAECYLVSKLGILPMFWDRIEQEMGEQMRDHVNKDDPHLRAVFDSCSGLCEVLERDDFIVMIGTRHHQLILVNALLKTLNGMLGNTVILC